VIGHDGSLRRDTRVCPQSVEDQDLAVFFDHQADPEATEMAWPLWRRPRRRPGHSRCRHRPGGARDGGDRGIPVAAIDPVADRILVQQIARSRVRPGDLSCKILLLCKFRYTPM
jgi:hypothetical protein